MIIIILGVRELQNRQPYLLVQDILGYIKILSNLALISNDIVSFLALVL
jgi:hypothetical protein